MPRNRVQQGAHEDGKEKEGAELYSLSHGAGNDGGGSGGKDHLEKKLGLEGNASPGDGAVNALVSVPGSWAIICSAQQPETVGPYKAVSDAEHQTPAQQKEGERGEGEDNEILGQDVDRVLSPAESRLQHREPQGHKHHKKCRH